MGGVSVGEYTQALVEAVQRGLVAGEAIASHSAVVIIVAITDDKTLRTTVDLEDVGEATIAHAIDTATSILEVVAQNRAAPEQ
jgi:hypothetical protein